jgi:hypothetical protein
VRGPSRRYRTVHRDAPRVSIGFGWAASLEGERLTLLPTLSRDFMMRFSLLSTGEARRVEAAVLALAEKWRGGAGTLHTLGSPAYQSAHDMAAYRTHAVEDNRLLGEHFGWLYARVFNLLEWVLGVPVVLAPNAALPGFHILDTAIPYPGGGLHVDSAHEALGLPPLPNLGDNVAFTLPIALPCDTGVDVAVDGYAPSESGRVRPLTLRCFKLQLGYLHVFAGNRPHQIGSCPAAPGLRMTLQGHAVPLGRQAAVFW